MSSAEAYLTALPRFADAGAAAVKPGLERIEALLDAMGRPEAAYPAVHVAGTNGKGSTASMVAAIGTSTGLRVGLHTSPHLHTLRERMRVDGVAAPEAWLDGAVGRYRAAIERVAPSFFEATVALSLLYFAERRVDLAVVEVGLGGRLDATGVVRPVVSLVTHVGLDHTELLGDTREAISREKAGIARPGVPLLTAAEGASVLAVIREEAERRGAPFTNLRDEARWAARAGEGMDLETPVRRYEALRVELPGAHQASNAALAVRAAEIAFGERLGGTRAVAEALANVRKLSGLAGRCERLHRTPLVLADVAHNADGIAAALATARPLVGGDLHVVIGLMRDKGAAPVAALLARERLPVWPVALATPRGLPLAEWEAVLRRAGADVRGPVPLAEALGAFITQANPTAGVLVTGSHLTVADARAALGLAP